MPSGTHCGMCKRDFISNKALNAHFKIHRKDYKGGKNGIRHWRIELYETSDGFRVVIDGLDHGEANGISAHRAYESAVAKMTVKPWLITDVERQMLDLPLSCPNCKTSIAGV